MAMGWGGEREEEEIPKKNIETRKNRPTYSRTTVRATGGVEIKIIFGWGRRKCRGRDKRVAGAAPFYVRKR